MTSAAAAFACSVFAAGMLHVIITDVLHRRIRNWLMLVLAATWLPLALAAGLPISGLCAAAAAAALVFAAGFGCFAAGWVGGGDVKLAAVAVLWLGAGQTPEFLLLAALLGAALALFVLLASARHLQRSGAAGGPQVPYGPALAAAALALLGGSPWTDAI